MFIDETSKQVLRSPGIPGFESLKKILIYTWGFQQLLFTLIRKDHETEKYYITKPVLKIMIQRK